MSALNSKLFQGWIRHRRYLPKQHSFRYPLFMCWLDLAELDQVMALSPFWSLERFNLVSFYFCYPEGTQSPRYILAEINNTPWNERFCYVLDAGESPVQKDKWAFEFDKAFHVSPFMPMAQHYRWQFSLHEPNLTIHMQLQQDHDSCFDATLQLKAQELSRSVMRTMPLRYPFLTLSVVVSIYWQALRLWLKGIPFYGHPDKQPE
jgi:DUF1365 family protein